MNRGGLPVTLFLVPSANHAIQGERALLGAGIPCRLIPVPRTLSSQCGVCLEVDRTDRAAAERILTSAGTKLDGTHDVTAPPVRAPGPHDPGETAAPAATKGEADDEPRPA